MERIRNLNRYQKGILVLLTAMLVIFTAAYCVVSSRVGFAYQDSILCPSQENGSTVYTGVIDGKEASFTVTADKTVTLRYGEKVYGPYTAREDPTAIPEDDAFSDYMTGVEIRQGKHIFFRGGVQKSGDGFLIYDEDGGFAGVSILVTMSNGTVVDENGSVVDLMEPSVSDILQLMEGPELTSKGEWVAWICGVFLSVAAAVSILFADELFRWNMAFQIRDADRAEPSDWEMAGRYISWTVMPVMALVIYIMGLQ